MNNQKLTKIIPIIIIAISTLTIFIELKNYTPINKDQTEIIDNYNYVTSTLWQKIEEDRKIQAREKEINDRIEYIKKTNARTNAYIKKYGIKKIINPKSGGEHDKKERAIICKVHNDSCERSSGYYYSWSPAFRFDFNGDGVSEIAGIITGGYGRMNSGLIIAQKQKNGEYEEIFSSHFGVLFPVKVVNHKTDGYYDISFTTLMGIINWADAERVHYIVKYNAKAGKYEFMKWED